MVADGVDFSLGDSPLQVSVAYKEYNNNNNNNGRCCSEDQYLRM